MAKLLTESYLDVKVQSEVLSTNIHIFLMQIELKFLKLGCVMCILVQKK